MTYNEMYIEGRQSDMSSEFSSLITFMIDDIKNFGSRNTSRSLTIILPGTSRNNDNFGHIFSFNSSNLYNPTAKNVGYNFNAAVGAKVIIFQNRVQIFKGILRLLEIIVDKGVVEYEVAVIGELGGFIFALGNKKLEELDFSSYDRTLSVENIVSSWDNPVGSGVYFPLIDYGAVSTNKHDWQYRAFRPALYAKEYIDKMFSAISYTYHCPLFDTPRFKSIIIPSASQNLTKKSSRAFEANSNAGFNITGSVAANQNATIYKIPLQVATVLGSFSASTDKTEYTYNSTTPINELTNFKISGTYTKTGTDNPNVPNSAYFTVWIAVNGVNTGVNFGAGNSAGSFDLTYPAGQPPIVVNNGNIISINIRYNGVGTYNINIDTASMFIDNAAQTLIPIGLGELIPINDTIPKNILQANFFTDILKLFNLYVIEDKYQANKLILTPFPDYYLATTKPIDWSGKMNREKPQRQKPLSELNARYYDFKYKDDNDYYNDLYKKRYNQAYGSYTFDSQYEFSKDSDSLEIGFSGTPLVGYPGEGKVYSTIFKKSGASEEGVDSNIRILQSKKINSSSWKILDGATTLGTYTSYGYAGHLDNPDAPANDLNFGVPKQLYFVLLSGALQVNQFNVYYSPYMAEITDKDSKLLTAYFWLTPEDIEQLDFARFIFVDGSLFRINKIEDYNATNEEDARVELLKVINTIY